jgi:flagellar hook-associated protein 3 FlgL
MRVTETIRFELVNRRLSSLRSKYQEASLQATTGQRVNAPSDDPVAAAEAARLRAQLSQTTGNQRTIDLVKGDVEIGEAALAQAGDVLQRARELAMAGANGANGDSQRQALATEASQLVSQMIEIANVKGSQGYLFSGTRTDSATLDTDGNFQGNDAAHLVQTGTGEPIDVHISGARAFTASAGGIDVIQTLRDLAAGLTTNNASSIQASLESLQTAHDQVTGERSHAGLVLNRLELSESMASQTDLDLQKRSADVVGIQETEAFSRLTQLQTAITNSVAVGKQVLDQNNNPLF